MARRQRTSRKKFREVPSGIAHIRATFNNTVITITDPQGNVLAWSTPGAKGFKGSKKSTPFAAQIAAQEAAKRVIHDYAMRTIAIYIKGPGSGRETAARALQHAGLKVTVIRDITPIPHNGCRPRKRRRV